MDYTYEKLGPDRFQQLCQSLLAREFPDLQCFPIAQPDGGRDAISYTSQPGSPETPFTVFQVKFVREPQRLQEPHRWLSDTLAGEAPKIARLIPKGARAYYLLTNVAGTGHPGGGSIDRLNSLLRKNIPIPAYCWWRDDLDRRMDNAWQLKWVYPELLSGTDLLRIILEGGLRNDHTRIGRALQTFLRKQYETEKKVRFKQVDLQNDLLQLFVDLPLSPSTLAIPPEQQVALRSLGMSTEHFYSQGSKNFVTHDQESLLATVTLLDPHFQQAFPHTVLEGAPGQGKSTLAQYICQIYRMRLLKEYNVISTLPRDHRAPSLRMPFKVDLRDYASWTGGQNPFSTEPIHDIPKAWNPSLEAFLAAQVRHLSGGVSFSIEDLHEVASCSSLLLVLDGLDEVAVNHREHVVREISDATRRLSEVAASLQVIVTSRPTAFASTAGLPEDLFFYFRLLPLTRPLVDDYAHRWLLARRLEAKDAADVRRILGERMEQPHLRDLARNPMQLTILLSLIHTRGSSLPDKRTALYDSYVALFLDRESEKSEIVRHHRDLLIDIHRYLAWMLHTEAEEGKTRGAIEEPRLRTVLSEYLKSEGRDVALLANLFTGLVERVVFLVSRMQGTFEFEVQPLREYFAARHLYETAPYSPTGSETSGTKPDRFEAIARNFYWLNVTRFYAGCYSKGELPGLALQLRELSECQGYCNTGYPARLAAMLLSDWVFSQHQPSTQEAVRILLGRLKTLSAPDRFLARSTADGDLSLPDGCGRSELLQHCLHLLKGDLPLDFNWNVVDIALANCSPEEIDTHWLSALAEWPEDRLESWFRTALHLETLSRLDKRKLRVLPIKGANSKKMPTILSIAGQSDFVEGSEERAAAVAEDILDNTIYYSGRSVLATFSGLLNTWTYARAFNHPEPRPLREVIASFQPDFMLESSPGTGTGTISKCRTFIKAAFSELDRDAREWAGSLIPWSNLVESARNIWGDRWAIFRIANISAAVQSKERFPDATDLLGSEVPLCRRILLARRRARSHTWWETQLQEMAEDQSLFVLLVLLTWADTAVITDLLDVISNRLDNLNKRMWQLLVVGLEQGLAVTGRLKKDSSFLINKIERELSERALVVLSKRAEGELLVDSLNRRLYGYSGDDTWVWQLRAEAAVSAAMTGSGSWRDALEVLAEAYARKVIPSDRPWRDLRSSKRKLPISIAEEIVANSDKFPSSLVRSAEERCRLEVGARALAVAKIAARDGWFGPPLTTKR